MNKFNYNNIDQYLLKKIPEFKTRYMKTISDFGPGLKYFIFGELSRYFIDIFLEVNDNNNTKKIEKEKIFYNIIEIIEELVDCGDKNVRELIYFGFLEMLPDDAYDCPEIINYLGPKTKIALNEINKFYRNMNKFKNSK
jgi:hypothetical protein